MQQSMKSGTYVFMQTQVSQDGWILPPPGSDNWELAEWNGQECLWVHAKHTLPAQMQGMFANAVQQGPHPIQRPVETPGPRAGAPNTRSGAGFTPEELGAGDDSPAGRAIQRQIDGGQG